MGIPRKIELEEYDDFVLRFGNLMERFFPDSSFYLYGSYNDGRAVSGVSDIDGGIIMNGGPVIDKEEVRGLSEMLKSARGGVPIPLQLNLLDRFTNIDGRFMSYDGSYVDWFKKGRARIVCGPDYFQEMNGLYRKDDELRSAAMNLRTMRNSLLNAEENMGKKYGQEGNIRDSFKKALDKLTGLPKKLAVVMGGDLDSDKRNAPLLLSKLLGNFRCPQLEEAMSIRSSQEKFREVVYDSDEKDVRRYLEEVVTGYETIVGEFIEKYPLNSKD